MKHKDFYYFMLVLAIILSMFSAVCYHMLTMFFEFTLNQSTEFGKWWSVGTIVVFVLIALAGLTEIKGKTK